MKIFLLLIFLLLLSGSFSFFSKKNAAKVAVLNYGSFTLKTEVSYGRRLNGNLKWVTETNVAYSVWYKNKLVKYPSPIQGNTGYSHLWRVYILGGAPKPTLIAGSQSLFMINEDDGKIVVTPLDEQNSDFANLQFLDSENDQPGTLNNVYMAKEPDSIQTLKGGDYLMVNQKLVLHVPDLKIIPINKLEEKSGDHYLIKTGGALSFSPDKKSVIFMGGNTDKNNNYHYSMIGYNLFTSSVNTLPYSRTTTRSINLNYDNRQWFNTYFEWTKSTNGDHQLRLKKYETLPYWEGLYKDGNEVYQLTPVKNELQQVFADYVLTELDLKKEDLHPGGQYSSNMMVIHYKNYKFDIWLRPEDSIIVLMLEDAYTPEAKEGIKIIHQLGDGFNKQLKSGKYQQYFTQLKD